MYMQNKSVTTFRINKEMEQTLERLKGRYGASSKAEVLRKAIALLEIASDVEEEGGEVVIKKGNKERSILLR